MSKDRQTRLEALVGGWRTVGQTRATAEAPAAAIEAVDTYQWLPGRVGLLHTVDARVGDEHVEGGEIIGWDPAREAYVTQHFGTDGPNSYEASLDEGRGTRLDHAQLDGSLRRSLQCRRRHHHRSLGASRRRGALASVDGRHADQMTNWNPKEDTCRTAATLNPLRRRHRPRT